MAVSSILQDFQFAQPLWLWGLALLPALWLLYALFYRQGFADSKIDRFVDPHLLPHLMPEEDAQEGKKKNRTARALGIWSLLWTLALLAMAGPRWDYAEVQAYAPAGSLVILLDLSRSMDAQDIKPSRLARARQEIEDMDRLAGGVNIGLIAFASVPHVITPLTDDKETLRRLLPSLKTDIVYTQGSNLAPALKRAGQMLGAEPGHEKHILILSDGGFDDGDAAIFREEKELTGKGVQIHVMGFGTAQGAPVPDGKGGYAKDGGTAVVSRIETPRLHRIAQDGKGLYLDAGYLENDTQSILAQVKPSADTKARKTTRVWEERFYIFLAPLVLFLLPWFRRNAAFPALLLVLTLNASPAQAFDWRDLFLNKAQQGKAALERKQYDEAISKFDDAYQRGVAQYKAGQYAQAAQSFASADRPDIAANAEYNLGNAQMMSGKIEDAIKSYENVLKTDPGHEDAAHNLEIAKKMLQQKQQPQNMPQDQKQDQSQQGQNQQNQNDQKQNGQDGKSQEQDGENAQSKKDEQQQKAGSDANGKPGQSQGEEPDAGEQDRDGQDQDRDRDRQEQEDKGTDDRDGDERDPDKDGAARRERDQSGDQSGDESQDQSQKQQGQQEQPEQQKQDQSAPAQDNAMNQEQKQDAQATGQKAQRTQQDINADQWLGRIKNEPEQFLKNKFYIESKRQGAKEGEKPW